MQLRMYLTVARHEMHAYSHLHAMHTSTPPCTTHVHRYTHTHTHPHTPHHHHTIIHIHNHHQLQKMNHYTKYLHCTCMQIRTSVQLQLLPTTTFSCLVSHLPVGIEKGTDMGRDWRHVTISLIAWT